MIYFTSDLHFFHDREFIYKPRGFDSEEEMREFYIEQWRETIKDDDDVYNLGDFCLGADKDKIRNLVLSLPGRIHLIIGNHDTDAKIELYQSCENIVEIAFATRIIHNGRAYYLSHYPTHTSSLEASPKHCVINLYGHIHAANKFYEDRPYMRNVSVDANNNRFLTFEEIEQDFNREVKKCISYLDVKPDKSVRDMLDEFKNIGPIWTDS